MVEAAVTSPRHHAGAHHGPNGTITQQVIHDEEYPLSDSSAETIARVVFSKANAGGCAHYVHDANSEQHPCPEDEIAWHAPPNTGSIGHERDGYASWHLSEWHTPKAQMTTCRMAARVAEICVRRRMPVTWLEVAAVRAHRAGITSHNNKSLAFHMSDHSDPGRYFPITEFMALVRTAYAWLSQCKAFQETHGLTADGVAGPATLTMVATLLAGAKPKPAPAPVKPAPPAPSHPGSTTTWHKVAAKATTLRLWDYDGDRAKSGPVHTLQAALHLPADGYYGQDTAAAVLQYKRAHGLPADGIAGPAMLALLYHVGPKVAPKHGLAFPHLKVDGVPGTETVKALKTLLKAAKLYTGAIDGSFGPGVRTALQKYLHVTADGVLGRISIAALQAHVGIAGKARDGLLGPDTWRHVQQALHDGKF